MHTNVQIENYVNKDQIKCICLNQDAIMLTIALTSPPNPDYDVAYMACTSSQGR